MKLIKRTNDNGGLQNTTSITSYQVVTYDLMLKKGKVPQEPTHLLNIGIGFNLYDDPMFA